MNWNLFVTRIGKLLQVIRSPRLVRALLVQRVLAGVEHRYILSKDIRCIVDIGANRGQFALAARQWCPEAQIISFEPLSQPAAVFRRLFGHDGMVKLHQAAIGPESGAVSMHVSGEDDSSSLLPVTGLQQRLFPGTAAVGREKIRVSRLADFVPVDEIQKPALLKLDVQGYELEALKGCEDLLGRFSNIYVECSFVELYAGQALAHEVIQWLADRGFALCAFYNPYYTKQGRPIQADFLFASASWRDDTQERVT